MEIQSGNHNRLHINSETSKASAAAFMTPDTTALVSRKSSQNTKKTKQNQPPLTAKNSKILGNVSNKGAPPLSLNQLGRIEQTSKRQMKSISKLQNKLTKTNDMMRHTSKGFNHRSSVITFASQPYNDYLEDSNGMFDVTRQNSPDLSIAHHPKKVKIASQSTQMMLKLQQHKYQSKKAMNSTQTSASGGGINELIHAATNAQTYTANGSSASAMNRSILKQKLLANKTTHSSNMSSVGGHHPPNSNMPHRSSSIGIEGHPENRFRISKSTMKSHVRTPGGPARGKKRGQLATTNATTTEYSSRKGGNGLLSSQYEITQQQQQPIQQPEQSGNADLVIGSNIVTPGRVRNRSLKTEPPTKQKTTHQQQPADYKQTTKHHSHNRQRRLQSQSLAMTPVKGAAAYNSNAKMVTRTPAAAPRSNQSSVVLVDKSYEQLNKSSQLIEGGAEQHSQQQLTVTNLDLEKLRQMQKSMMNDKQTIEHMGSSTRRQTKTISNYQKQEEEHLEAIKKESGILNNEQRQVVSQLIDKLDIQEAIRQKAQVFFKREQKRIANEVRSNHHKYERSYHNHISNEFLNESIRKSSIQSDNRVLHHIDDDVEDDGDYLVSQFVGSSSHKKTMGASKSSGVAQKQRFGMKRNINASGDAGDSSDDDDKEMLNNMFSERMVASQSEIKAKLHKMISNKDSKLDLQAAASGGKITPSMLRKNKKQVQQILNQRRSKIEEESMSIAQDTLTLTDGQIFDKDQDVITLGTSIGGSIIPPDAAEPHSVRFNQIQQDTFQSQAGLDDSSSKRNQKKYRTGGVQISISTERIDHTPSMQLNKQDANQSSVASLPSIHSRQINAADSSREEHHQFVNASQINLLQLSKQFKKAQKEKLAKTMYNKRKVEPRHKLESFKKDYSQLILGEYRFGLNQKAPRSNDPNAPAALRFSQMACYRFAESNSRFMELYDKQMMDYRKTRRFLSQQIAKSPEGKKYARQLNQESPLLQQMHRKLQLQLIDETIREEESTMIHIKQTNYEQQQQKQQFHDTEIDGLQNKKSASKNDINKVEIKGLKDIQKYNKTMKSRQAKAQELSSNFNTQSSNSTIRRMRVLKNDKLNKLIEDQSLPSIGSRSMKALNLSTANNEIFDSNGGLDLYEDFISDASDDEQNRMKKATYEMDQIVTDKMFKHEQNKMGLSLYYHEQEIEQKRFFRLQQKELMRSLNILFGGNNESNEFISMAKNLTKQLRRQGTDDSYARKRGEEICNEAIGQLQFDEDNINTEIVEMIAQDLLKKKDFFDLFKENVRGQKGLVQASQLKRLQEKEDDLTVDERANRKTLMFRHVNDMHAGGVAQGLSPKGPTGVDQHVMKQEIYQKQVVQSAGNLTQFEDKDFKTVHDVQQEMAKTSFINECEKNMVVTLPLLLRIKDKKLIMEGYQLNNGLCNALSLAFSHFKDIATDFHLTSNGMIDEDLAVLLNGASHLTHVNSIAYQHNTFGHKSLEAIMPIITKKQIKHSLRSLHLKHCKMTSAVTQDLLYSFNRTKNYLRSLSLVNVNINSTNYRELCKFIKSSRHLQELDISWNGMRCHQVYELIDVIADNRTLQDLNLSFNNLHDSMQEKFAESTPFAKLRNIEEKKKQEAKLKSAKTQAQKAAAEIDSMDNSMQHIMKICKFIKMNNNLMHLNLSGMGMTSEMMFEFGRALRRTKSLVSLHLSQNNGDNLALRTHLVERAHVKTFEPNFHPDFKQIEMHEYQLPGEAKGHKRSFKLENSICLGAQQNDEEARAALGKSKISEQLNLKNMLKNKRGSVNRQQVENDASEMLVFTRYLGHKTEIPGSGQWRMISTSNDSQERCWVCNLEVYSLVFWSRDYGFKTQREMFKSGIDEMACENQLYELEQRNADLGINVDFYADKGNPQLHEEGHKLVGYPQIYSEFNNWKPQRMYTIEELCYIMDDDKPDILKQLKKGNYVNEMVQDVKDLNEKEKTHYNDRMNGVMQKYHKMKNWRKLLGSQLRYKRPFLGNAEALLIGNEDVNLAKMDEELYPSDSESDFGSGTASDASSAYSPRRYEEPVYEKSSFKKQQFLTPSNLSAHKPRKIKHRGKMNRQLYVMPCFLTPGKQTFVVQSQIFAPDIPTGDDSVNFKASSKDNLTSQFFFHQVVAPHRRERVPLHVKQLKRKTNDGPKFDKDNTVFKDWNQPTEKDLQKMLEHDKAHWKLPRFIKDEQQLADVIQVFQDNMRAIFHVFITQAAGSSFPGINWLDFTKFAETCHVIQPGVNQADVDRYFLAATNDQGSAGAHRFHFLEAVMRVADAKYLKSGLVKTFAQALKKFLDDNVFKYGPTNLWQGFRDTTWWNYENHEVLLANQKEITKVYKSHWAPRKKFMNKTDCLDLMIRVTKIMPDEKNLMYCYGMSKMHVVSETTNKNVYEEMKLIEFQEFLGRCAFVKYRDHEEEPMVEKLKMLLDELFPNFGLVRKEVEDMEEELSESDPDY